MAYAIKSLNLAKAPHIHLTILFTFIITFNAMAFSLWI